VTVRSEYTIGFDVTLLKVLAMFASLRGMMSEGSADDQWRLVFVDSVYQVIKGN